MVTARIDELLRSISTLVNPVEVKVQYFFEIIWKCYEIDIWFVLAAYRKSYLGFQLVTLTLTLMTQRGQTQGHGLDIVTYAFCTG